MDYDVIVVGAGPAGLAAALYTSRARLSTVILEKGTMGGELMNRDLIENYPGFPEGVQGPDLGSKLLEQVMNYGAKIELAETTRIRVQGDRKIVETPQEQFSGRGIIIAAGAHPRKLGVPGEAEFADKGVFYCATCDGPQFANKVVAVAGAGDSGLTEAIFLSKFVSRVKVLEIMPQPGASKILQERALANPRIEMRCGVKIESITGDDGVRGVNIEDVKTGRKETVAADGILVHIGLEPNTTYLNGFLKLNARGQVVVTEKLETSAPGIFAAGDIRDNSPMQIATAVGDGVTAAINLQKRFAGAL